VQDVSDLMQRLINVWAGLEPMTSGAGVSMPAFEPQDDTLNIHCDTNHLKLN